MGLDMYLTRRNKAKDLEVEIYYWRKLWDLYEYDPKETNINGQEVHVDKELFEKIFKFCCYHSDYFDTFNSLPKLAEELHYFDERTEEGWTYYFMGDY